MKPDLYRVTPHDRREITITFSTGRRVPKIPADVCAACGEQFLDPDAMAIIRRRQ